MIHNPPLSRPPRIITPPLSSMPSNRKPSPNNYLSPTSIKSPIIPHPSTLPAMISSSLKTISTWSLKTYQLLFHSLTQPSPSRIFSNPWRSYFGKSETNFTTTSSSLNKTGHTSYVISPHTPPSTTKHPTSTASTTTNLSLRSCSVKLFLQKIKINA